MTNRDVEISEFIREHWEVLSDQEIADKLGVSYKTVKGRRQRMGLLKSSTVTKEQSKRGNAVNEIVKLLEDNGIPPEEIAVEKLRLTGRRHINKETGVETQTHSQSLQLALAPDWESGPEWPVVQQAKPNIVKPLKLAPRKADSNEAFVLPDPQIGFRVDQITGELDPFHDRKAMDVALMMIEDENPDLIVNLGDFIDFPEFGKFEQEPAFANTTQKTIDEAYNFLCQQRAAAPNAKIVLIEGNHDRRLQKAIISNAKAAFGLRRAASPDGWPVLSIPYLLRLEELDVEYVEGYPAGEYYINDRLKCIHGKRSGRRGRIAPRIVDDEHVSTITGHTHHIEMAYKTTNARKGPRTNLGITMGCLCRIDGAVPSFNGSTDSFGRPVKTYLDWQQGVGVVYYQDGDGPFSINPVLIHEGSAILNGKLYTA